MLKSHCNFCPGSDQKCSRCGDTGILMPENWPCRGSWLRHWVWSFDGVTIGKSKLYLPDFASDSLQKLSFWMDLWLSHWYRTALKHAYKANPEMARTSVLYEFQDKPRRLRGFARRAE